MKKLLLFLSFICINLFAGEVNVYSSRHYSTDKILYDMFEKETGIKVNVINDKPDALIKKIELEGKDTPADVFITVGAGDIYNAKKSGILQSVHSHVIQDNVPTNFRDKDGYWTALSYRARVLIYNPEKVSVNELSTYEDLANPKWKGRVLTRSSSSSYNKHLIAFLLVKDGEKETREWAKGLVKNFARDPQGNDRAQAVAVLKGVGDVAIMNSYYMGKMSIDKNPDQNEAFKKLKLFFPNQKDGGTHINISAAGVTKYAKNKENAIKFIEFLTTVKAQESISNDNFEYPVNKMAKTNELVKSWGEFKISNIDFEAFGKKLTEAKFIADEASWK